MAKTKTEKIEPQKNESVSASAILPRGRFFEGTVIKKFPGRIVLTFERTVYVPKLERYYKKKTKLHARLPAEMNINVGDYIKIQECRPLSKIIHFIVIEKLRDAKDNVFASIGGSK